MVRIRQELQVILARADFSRFLEESGHEKATTLASGVMNAWKEMGRIEDWRNLAVLSGKDPTLRVEIALSALSWMVISYEVLPLTKENALAMEVLWS